MRDPSGTSDGEELRVDWLVLSLTRSKLLLVSAFPFLLLDRFCKESLVFA